MQRVAAVVMILCYIALGSGAMEYWHNAQHAAQDATMFPAGLGAPHGNGHDHGPIHDESNCPIHAKLHLAGLAVAWVPLLVFLGLFIAFVTMLAPPPVARQIIFALPCRGPPAR